MTWIQTYTGRQFYPVAPRPEDIDILDIAHALAMRCRYGGHAKQFYSVAQHSVLVARHVPAEDKLRALLHDALEAYSPFGDIPRPSRVAVAEESPIAALRIAEIEDRIERAIAATFDLPFPIKNEAIAEIDTRILHDEREHVMTWSPLEWDVPGQGLGVEIERWSPHLARGMFLRAFESYREQQRKRCGRAEDQEP